MPISPDDYKHLMRHWATGVTVITTLGPDGPHGMTANSFTGVSLDPPLILVCIDQRTRTHDHLKSNPAFGVHVLRQGQEELSQRCAGLLGEEAHRLADVPHTLTTEGIPLLDDCLARLECRVKAIYEGGDHTIFLAEVHATHGSDGDPLVYFNRGYRRLAVGDV